MTQHLHVYDAEEFQEQVEMFADSYEDRLIVLGDYTGTPRLDDKNIKRYGDFVFPAELFANESTTGDLERSNADLIATGVFDKEYLDLEAGGEQILDYEEYAARADEIASSFDEPVFVTGVFKPGGNYHITGNPENNKPRRLASMEFPEAVFDAAGCNVLRQLHLGFPGTIVVEADDLDDETVAFAHGEADELPVYEREDDRMDPEEVHEVVRSLSLGDRVKVNDRTRPLEVVSRTESRMIGVAGRETKFLRGNGTDYRIALGDRTSKRPELEWSSDSAYVDEIEVVERATEPSEVEA